jgi:hypothetical protein
MNEEVFSQGRKILRKIYVKPKFGIRENSTYLSKIFSHVIFAYFRT